MQQDLGWSRSSSPPLKHDSFGPPLIFSRSLILVLSLSAVTLPPIYCTYLLCQLSSCIRGPRRTDALANSMPHTWLIPVAGHLSSPFDAMPPVHLCQPCLCREVPPIASGPGFCRLIWRHSDLQRGRECVDNNSRARDWKGR